MRRFPIYFHPFIQKRGQVAKGAIGHQQSIAHAFFVRLNYPVFTDAGSAVFKKLCEIVHPPAAGWYNFNNPVRCTETSFIGELIGVAYNRNIRFDIICIIFIQKYCKWGYIHFTRAIMGVDIFADDGKYFPYNPLVLSGWGRHVINLAVNQFRPAAFRSFWNYILRKLKPKW